MTQERQKPAFQDGDFRSVPIQSVDTFILNSISHKGALGKEWVSSTGLCAFRNKREGKAGSHAVPVLEVRLQTEAQVP